MHMVYSYLLLAGCWLGLTSLVVGQEYNRDILPILSERCFACHGPDEQARQGGLRLDFRESALAEADSGEHAIVPSAAESSELLRRIESLDDSERMPPPESGEALTAEQQQLLRQWIESGADYQLHWSFVPPLAVEPPLVSGVEHPIDRFVQARLAQEGLSPAPLAPVTTLLRRVSLDLIGLPPTLAEIDAFEAAAAKDPQAAYAATVDRLLSSPHYGERWGRWWLDQARYADSNGYSIDAPRQIWKYRDWVVDALNRDMPFDQFTIEQLAGDLLPESSDAQQSVSRKVATGFHRNTPLNQEGGIDVEQFRVDSVFDRVATTGTVWLGLTIGCAQCHDHKFDPITQKEYYQFFAFFNNQDEPTLEVADQSASRAELKAELKIAETELDDFIAAHAADYDAWERSLTAEQIEKFSSDFQNGLKTGRDQRTPKQVRGLFGIEVGKIDSQYQTLKQQVETLADQVAGVTTTLVLRERSQARTTTIFVKGDFTRPAEVVMPQTPEILHPLLISEEDPHESADPNTPAAPNRLDLARWIVSADNPLTARVVVNRVWQVYFGRGLVETENDFGTLGTLPSHPELLDWLAVELQSHAWSLKELHRLIVTSHTYRQSSQQRDELLSVDPRNYLLGRQQRLRLEAELIRDVELSAVDLISPQLGGPPVYPPIPAGVMDVGQVKREWKTSRGSDRFRRGMYTFLYRATPPPELAVFDAPEGLSTCTRRLRSNTPLQALTLLNDAGFFEFATALQAIIDRDGMETAFRRCTGRRPCEDELQILAGLDSLSAARVLLNLDETLTRE
ncbi:MAG: PSD1 and planctomycete cytochrome C domain-containing protein [Aureliella sp.]